MTISEAIKELEPYVFTDEELPPTIRRYSEALSMAIEALKTVQEHKGTFEWCVECKENDAPSADRPKNMIHIDEVYRLIAGHSNYHGDSILSAFTCLVEGKDVKPIAPLDESADRPTGEWIKTEHCLNDTGCRRWIEIECPYCGERPTYEFLENMNYCPNCGKYMKGENK